MPRKRTGSVVTVTLPDGTKVYQGIVTLNDGTRHRLTPCAPGTSKKRAKDYTAYWSKRFAEEGLTAEDRGAVKPRTKRQRTAELDGERWVKAWLDDRAARGIGKDAASHWQNHIAPVLGEQHIRAWTPGDVRRFVAHLDRQVQRDEMSWKTAVNIFGTVTVMCSDAAAAKNESLRCRADNPALGVRGPDRGVRRQKQVVFPDEATAVLSCSKVPLRWRRYIAIALYTGVRAGELRALRWSDVDFEHDTIHVHRSYNNKKKCIESTKGMLNRRVPIEPALRPLLEAMHREVKGKGLVAADLASERRLAPMLRRYLQVAGVSRVDLFESCETSKALAWHDLRGTNATWCAVRGDDGVRIQTRLGHRHFQTTQGYIDLARTLDHSFGEPFPELPPGLVSITESIKRSQVRGNRRRERDSNPRCPCRHT